MILSEPMTMATDFVLAAQGFVYARWLGRLGRREGGVARLFWARAFAAMAVGALAGGVAHGFAVPLGPTGQRLVWKATVWSIGLASFLLLASAFTATFRPAVRRWLLALAAAKLAVYTIWMAWHDDFLFVILDYGSSLLLVAALNLHAWFRHRSGAEGSILAGIGASIAAAAVQQSGLELHRHLNADVLYHLIQMVGLYLLYRGGRELRDASPDRVVNFSLRSA